MVSREALAIFGGERLRPDEPVDDSGVNFLFVDGLNRGEAEEEVTLVELARLDVKGPLDEDFVLALFLKATGEAPGDAAAILLWVRGLVVDFVTAEAVLETEAGLDLGEGILSELEVFFFFEGVGERGEVELVDDFLLPSGDEVPLDFLVMGVDNLELPFPPKMGLPLGDEAFVEDVPILVPLPLDLGEREVSLLVDDGLEPE